MTRYLFLMFAAFALGLAGCKDEAIIPEPVKLTREAIGQYCNMIVADHPGPKIQVHEKDYDKPVWFSSVRDGLAYLMLPGEAQKVTAVYVHDMGRAASWERPQDEGIWMKAKDAHYVIGSARRGGMGAQEAVPFLKREEAELFTKKHGGTVVDFENIPQSYILGDQDDHAPANGHEQHHKKHGS